MTTSLSSHQAALKIGEIRNGIKPEDATKSIDEEESPSKTETDSPSPIKKKAGNLAKV